ncbi:DNA-processing protein DprA [Bacillota bacterium Meth-B3]|nr:DNA-processing protein DprA [Christensenellaceae bacterium]MEA5067268.1 DNA-processing protein DprA [Eubacteriales bacterium]
MTINHNDDAFATMLLMSQITPSREELVRPLSAAEWHALNSRAREAGLPGLGALLGLDMSGFMMKMDLTEQEAYRLCVLLGRTLPLSMSLERFAMNGIEVATYFERAYPQRLRERLGTAAPPMIYLAGRSELFLQDAIAIVGALPARGEAEEAVRQLVQLAVAQGYVVVTDGSVGLSRIAEDEAIRAGGRTVEVAADALTTRVAERDMLLMIEMRQGAALSLVHPDAPYTMSHAQRRNKCVYALSQAAFVFAVEEKKGAAWDGACEALTRRWCDALYAWDTDLYSGNRALIARGATAISKITPAAFDQMALTWRSQAARQLSMFDRGEPLP